MTAPDPVGNDHPNSRPATANLSDEMLYALVDKMLSEQPDGYEPFVPPPGSDWTTQDGHDETIDCDRNQLE